jgi:hypothetical protein
MLESEIVAERIPGLMNLLRDKPAFTMVEASYLACASVPSLYRAVRSGRLVTAGRGRVLREDLEKYLRAMRSV